MKKFFSHRILLYLIVLALGFFSVPVLAAPLSFKAGDIVWVKRTIKPKDPMQQKRFDTLYRIKKVQGPKTVVDIYEKMIYGTLLVQEDVAVTTTDINDDELFEVSSLALMPAPVQPGFMPSDKLTVIVDKTSVSSTSLSTTTSAVIPNKLQVFGDIQVGTENSSGCVQSYDGSPLAGTCLSDERLKEEIRPFESILDKLVKLAPVTYYFRSEEFPEFSFGPNKQYGLIAQQVEPLLPELVANNVKMGYKGVNYQLLPIYLLEGVKELSERVDALRVSSGELLQGSVIRSIEAGQLTVSGTAVVKGTLTVEDHVGFGIDTVGQAKITTGTRTVAVSFSKQYTRPPVVVAAPVDFTGQWKMGPARTDGFSLELTASSTEDVVFNWYAFEGSEKMTISVSQVPNAGEPLIVQPPALVTDNDATSPGSSRQDSDGSQDQTVPTTTVSSSSHDTPDPDPADVMPTPTTHEDSTPEPAPEVAAPPVEPSQEQAPQQEQSSGQPSESGADAVSVPVTPPSEPAI